MPSAKIDKAPHDHDFKSRKDGVRECYCGYTKMSREVFQERRKAWRAYHIKVWDESTAARRFRTQLKAYKDYLRTKDPEKLKLVKAFAAKASEQIKNGDWEISQPSYQDPAELDVRRLLWID